MTVGQRSGGDRSHDRLLEYPSYSRRRDFGVVFGAGGRRFEEWLYRPKLVVEFLPNEGGFRTEGKWRDPRGTEFEEIYVRARVRNLRSRVAKQCRPYLVKIEEVHTSGQITPTKYFDNLPLLWPGPKRDYNPRDLPTGVHQFFDVVGVLKNARGWRFKFGDNFGHDYDELPNYTGTYRFTVMVTGDGVAPGGRKIDVTYHGDWHNLRALDAGPLGRRRAILRSWRHRSP
jgi:hypothetical protein